MSVILTLMSIILAVCRSLELVGLGLVRVRRPPPYPAQTLLGPKQRGWGGAS